MHLVQRFSRSFHQKNIQTGRITIYDFFDGNVRWRFFLSRPFLAIDLANKVGGELIQILIRLICFAIATARVWTVVLVKREICSFSSDLLSDFNSFEVL